MRFLKAGFYVPDHPLIQLILLPPAPYQNGHHLQYTEITNNSNTSINAGVNFFKTFSLHYLCCFFQSLKTNATGKYTWQNCTPPLPRRGIVYFKQPAGLLTYSRCLSSPSRFFTSGMLKKAYLFTVAGPYRICTGFPFLSILRAPLPVIFSFAQRHDTIKIGCLPVKFSAFDTRIKTTQIHQRGLVQIFTLAPSPVCIVSSSLLAFASVCFRKKIQFR